MEHPLDSNWTLYVTKERTSNQFETETKDWENRILKIFKFESVEMFWKVINNLKTPNEMLDSKADVYLFKENILPEWEDSENVGGGVLSILADRGKVDDVWLKTILNIVGNNFDEDSEIICGAELAVRVKRFRISLWIKNTSTERVIKIGTKLKSHIGNVTLEYKKHGSETIKARI